MLEAEVKRLTSVVALGLKTGLGSRPVAGDSEAEIGTEVAGDLQRE